MDVRVLFWIRRRAAPRGGDLVALEHTLAALRARGVRCDVSDDPAHALDAYDLVHVYNLADANAAVEYVAAAVQQDKPLVVTPIYWRHAQWLDARRAATAATHPEFFLGALSADARALSQRVITQSDQVSRAAHQLTCDAAARIFALSHAEVNLLVEDFHAPLQKLGVTYNGVDPSFADGSAERFTREFGFKDFIFSAARIEERKNTIGVIRAWRAENAPLVFAGLAPEPEYLEQCQREAGTHVHFLGALAPQQIADAYAAARVHVLASWWEEVGLAGLEAGLAGCNVVMTKNGPASEYFGDACFICDPADPRSIYAALRAAHDAPRQTHLAPKIRATFTWERAAAVLYDAYVEIAARPDKFRPRVETPAWLRVSAALAELAHLRESYLPMLEASARETAVWARELQAIVVARNTERARLLNLPFAHTVRKLIRSK